jgi:periplasmic protein TonB
MPPSAHLFRTIPLSGKSVALLLSASMHAAVALAAVRGAPHASLNANRAEEPTLEVAELELTPAEAPVAEVPSQKSALAAMPARHHHDYAVPPDHDATAHDPSLKHVLPVSAPNTQPAVAAAAPAVVEAPAQATPRFVMTIGASTRTVVGAGVETGTNEAQASGAPGQPIAETSADVPAKLLAGGTPSYTRDAEAAGIEADVPLEIVVDATGSVIGARALTRVGYGLDEAALRSVRGYRFSPAQRAGKAQAVRMRWLMRFQLR